MADSTMEGDLQQGLQQDIVAKAIWCTGERDGGRCAQLFDMKSDGSVNPTTCKCGMEPNGIMTCELVPDIKVAVYVDWDGLGKVNTNIERTFGPERALCPVCGKHHDVQPLPNA